MPYVNLIAIFTQNYLRNMKK